MARKNRLDAVTEFAIALIGIATSHRDYKLVHYINESLQINLINEEDLPVFNVKNDSLSYFPFFTYYHPDLRTDFCLIANNNNSTFLIPSLKQINFFLLMQGAAYQQHIDTVSASLRKIQGVQAAILVNQSGIKEIGPLLEDIELHKIEIQKKAGDSIVKLYKNDEE
ncbi:MAG: IPExxxVDY family protein [Bacteroidales bacterium]|nr:IPExxxVDY family protein [Bacteroidales bacterium]